MMPQSANRRTCLVRALFRRPLLITVAVTALTATSSVADTQNGHSRSPCQRRESLARWGWCLVVGFILSINLVGFTSAGEWVLYDNFDASDQINPEKWFGSETRRPNATLEAYRLVSGGKLHLSAVGYGSGETNRGRQTGNFGLGVKILRPITAVQAELTVTKAVAEHCPENPHSTQSRAQLVGFFFNAGTQRATGDLTGYVVALMEKVADSKDGHFIRALVLRCTSASCSQGESIKALLFKRSWTLSEPDILRIEWEPPRFQFVFTVNPVTEAAETRRIAYDPATQPSQSPKTQLQRIRVRHHAASCKSGHRRALMAASVDDVSVRYLDPKAIAPLVSETAISEIE